MPIKTYAAAFPVETADDVTALVELLGRAAADDRLRDSLGDHFAYAAGTRPGWFRSHQETVLARHLDGFDVTFDNLCVLLNGAPDRCAEHLERRLRSRWSYQAVWALTAVGTEAALTAIAGLIRDGADPRKESEDSGLWTRPPGRVDVTAGCGVPRAAAAIRCAPSRECRGSGRRRRPGRCRRW